MLGVSWGSARIQTRKRFVWPSLTAGALFYLVSSTLALSALFLLAS